MRKLFVKLFSLVLVLMLLGAYIPVNATTTDEGTTAPLCTYKLSDDFAYSQGVGNWYYKWHTRVDRGFSPDTWNDMTATVTADTKTWKGGSNSSPAIYLDATTGEPIFNSHKDQGNVVVAFKAPFTGTITIEAASDLTRPNTDNNSVSAFVFKGTEQLVTLNTKGVVSFESKTTDVNKGDYISFATNAAAGNTLYRELRWDPVIKYTYIADMDTTYVLSDKYSTEEQGNGGFHYMAQTDIDNTPFDENELKQMKTKVDGTYGTIWSLNSTTPYFYMAGRSLKEDNGAVTDKKYPIFVPSTQGRNPVVEWKAPYSGIVSVTANGNITVAASFVAGRAISMPCRLYMGNNLIWEGRAPRAMNSSLEFPEKKLYVNKGDSLYFVVERYNEAVSDCRVAWDPIIKYTEFAKSDFEISSNIYKDDAVTALKDVKANDQVNVSVNVSSDTGFDNVIKGKAIVAFYKDGALADLSVADYDNNEVMVPVTMIEDGNELAMKVFVLKDFTSLTPLSEAFTID